MLTPFVCLFLPIFFFVSSLSCIQLFLDSHEHDDSNNKKADEGDFFADCENDLNGFSQNNNFLTENDDAADAKVRMCGFCN